MGDLLMILVMMMFYDYDVSDDENYVTIETFCVDK
jgi:hypothetical protein